MESYSALNLPIDATPDEIRSAYFDAARKYHPDANNGEEDGRKFIEIQQAYDTLSHPARRAAYDRSLPQTYKSAPEVQVEVSYSRSTIHKSNNPQLLYALLDLSCLRKSNSENLPPAHICIILDRSSSMKGERLDMVRSNIIQLLHKLKPTDVISIVTFSDRAEVLVPPTVIGELKRPESQLFSFGPGGATEIFQGLELGFEVFRRFAGRSNFLKHLILITDGQTYGDEELCFELAARSNGEGISINALGIGHEWNDTFLDRLASLSGGKSVYIRNREDLAQFIEQKIQALNVNYARRAELHLELPDYVQLTDAFRILPDGNPLEVQSPVQLGAVGYGRKTSVILEFKINQLSVDQTVGKIARGKVFFEVPTKPIPFERLYINLERPITSAWVKEKVPTAIFNAMSQLSLYRLQEKAREEAAAGDTENATQHLKFLATHLMARGNHELANSALLEVDRLNNQQGFSEAGQKDIKYGTRSLFLLPSPEN